VIFAFFEWKMLGLVSFLPAKYRHLNAFKIKSEDVIHKTIFTKYKKLMITSVELTLDKRNRF